MVQEGTSNLAPRPPLERRARREEVLRRLVRGDRVTEIAEQVAGMHGVSPRMVHKDIRLLRRRILRGDATMPLRQVQAMEGYARDLASAPAGLEAAGMMRYRIGKLLGMGSASRTLNLNLDARSQTVNVILPEPRNDALVTDPEIRELERAALRRMATLAGAARNDGVARVVDSSRAPDPAERRAPGSNGKAHHAADGHDAAAAREE